MNSAVDPFLMKKLLKSGICGSVNSARMHCSPRKSQLLRAKQKKKKKEKNAEQKRKCQNHLNPNGYIIFSYVSKLIITLVWYEVELWRWWFIHDFRGLFGYRLFCRKLKTYCWKHWSKIIFKMWIVSWDPKMDSYAHFWLGREQCHRT